MADFVPIDFGRLAAALLSRVDEFVQRWLPNGVERNGRWYIGDFDGNPGESANVNLRTGQWIDNGAPDQDVGGDLISLYARIRNLSNGEAARELIAELGWERQAARPVQTPARSAATQHPGERPAPAPDLAPDDGGPPPDDGPPAEPGAVPAHRARTERWLSVLPVPKHAPVPTRFRHGFKDRTQDRWVEFEAVRTWEYAFEGERFGYVARFERVNSKGETVKDTLPLTWCQDLQDERGSQRWHWKQWAAPRPLYVPATLLSGTPADVPVVIVEGEKCAEAGHQLLGHEFDFVSWPGGCKAWAMARWGWLMGRTVYLWPDADAQRQRLTREERDSGVLATSKPVMPLERQPGYQAMVGIGSLLLAQHGCTVYMLPMKAPGARPDGWDIADAIAQGWDAAKVRDYIRSGQPFVAPDDAARAKVGNAPGGISTPPSAGAGEDDGGDSSWRKHLLLAGSGAVRPVRENVVLALDGLPEKGVPGVPEAAGVVAFNEFTNDVMKLKDSPWGTPAGVWDETDELELGNWLVRTHWLPSMPRGTLEEAVAMVSKRHRFHPVRQQLDGLRGTWDGHKRLSTWLRRCCLEEDEWDDADPLHQYLQRVGTWMVMAICARVLQPGVKFDYMPIFEGGQGMGKSTLARILGGDYFADTGLVLGDKDSYQNLQGVLIYEWGELDSLTKAEVTKVKSFISSAKDRFRASFDRRPKDYPRQVVFIGTTNEDHYLVDPTGNRRFWPVRVTRRIDLEWLRANRDQMFAEALTYFEAGERFFPTFKEQRDLFDPQQQQRQIENAIAAAVLRYLYDADQRVGIHNENGTLVNEISAPELLGRLGISVDKQTHVLLRQATAALRQAGWHRFRSSRGDRPWMFKRPTESPHVVAGVSESSTRPQPGAQPTGTPDDCPF
jgi:putative DNA primase/helicase